MSEAKIGEEFVKHELDEAIAVQQAIVTAEEALATSHPMREAQSAIETALREDRTGLKDLQTLGKKYDATGKVEDVAGGLTELMSQTLASATSDGADSDYYEAHAVLLNLKRKQMDSAGGMVKIARAIENPEMRDAATEFGKVQRQSSQVLADELANYAAHITTAGL
jgi:hypothetical protein